ncbi:Predicted ATPase, AAA+ ATPase superfamily [Micromonospora pattaloongensis]|uniref:Predicted ATPase, AAA+ ATPase superfamily n=1 Tax=Micromonospora pattaloongensis TaxID=405436 RepID=A0A1H3R250_9ACTN|nr:Predicted ATPase, AAA+ ATPase superfamily [Micromonospora pattaloongensis]
MTDDGRIIRVPIGAVRSATAHHPTPRHRSQRPTSRQGKASEPAPQQELGRVRSQGDIARGLRETLRTAALQHDYVKRTELISARLAQDLGFITSSVNRQRAEAVLEVAGKLLRLLQCGDDTKVSDSDARTSFFNSERNVRKGRSHQGRAGTLPTALDEIFETLIEIERLHSKALAEKGSSAPRILTQDTVNVTRGNDNEFELPVRVSLDQPSLSVRNVRLILDKFRNLKVIGSLPVVEELRAGESPILTARMRDNRKQGSRTEVRVDAHLSFIGPGGATLETPRQTLIVKIHGKEEHQEIANPFRAYAGGLPVSKREMFFGRRTLIDEFVRELAKPPGGMCYALYGQQRTGKSSVLEQVRLRLTERGAIVASLSMGTIDRRSMTVDFVEEILDQFRVQLDRILPSELSDPLLARWPDATTIERRPLRSLQRAREAGRTVLRRAGFSATPFVVVVDEFTYLHEVLRRRGIEPREHNELRDFMRQLKGILEARLFSALLVGQDTMPRFLESYPNEFSVMATRRLDYLSLEETQALADVPVRTPQNASRYTGYALSTIATYTEGHPFFTQILCDRIIEFVNSRRRSNITQSDVEEAVESLLSGNDCIEPHKFDCLVSADNTHSLLSAINQEHEEDGSRLAMEVLRRIALLSGSQNNPISIEALQLEARQTKALEDLRMRGVIRETDTGVAIRVLLYADYLRRRAS